MAMVVASGCGDEASSTETTTTVRLGPLTPRDPERIPPDQQAAIAALAAAVSPESPESPGEHAGHDGHAASGPASTVPLSPADQRAFDAEWSAAVAAVSTIDTPAEATEAGYTRAAVQGSGVGVHWVNWELIDAPFDPTRPSMLLFDERDGRERPRRASRTGCAARRRRGSLVRTTSGTNTRTSASSTGGSIGSGQRRRPTVLATSWPGPTSGCCTPGWCRATTTRGVRSPRCTQGCVQVRARPSPTSRAARAPDRRAVRGFHRR